MTNLPTTHQQNNSGTDKRNENMSPLDSPTVSTADAPTEKNDSCFFLLDSSILSNIIKAIGVCPDPDCQSSLCINVDVTAKLGLSIPLLLMMDFVVSLMCFRV